MENQGLLAPEQNVDPAIQEQLDMFISIGISIIHDKKVTGQLLKQLKVNKDAADVMGKMLVLVVSRVEANADKSGVQIADEVKISGANHLLSELITVAEKAGMPALNEEQKYQAFSLATSIYLNNAVKSGRITKEQLMEKAESAKQTPEGQKIAQAMQQGGGQTVQGGQPMQGGQPQPQGGGV